MPEKLRKKKAQVHRRGLKKQQQESSFLTKCELKENIKNYSLVASDTSSPNNINNQINKNRSILVNNSAPGTVVGGTSCNFGILNQHFDGSVSPNMSLNPLSSATKIRVNDFFGSEPISRNDEDLVKATKMKPQEMQTSNQEGEQKCDGGLGGDSFQPIICMDYQMVARRRSVRNSDQKLRQ